jgi:hypothetical protein
VSDTPVDPATIVLYDATLGGTPDTQGKLAYRASPEAAAAQWFADGCTVLDSMASQRDSAGYFGPSQALPALDRAQGFALHFTVQVVDEYHADSDKDGDGVGDRAGFSAIALGSDMRGIELGFWPGEVWAQQDGAAEPPAGTLFTRAEHAPFDTSSRLVAYTLAIHGDTYTLSAGGAPILSGRLRDYTAFEGPVNPYRTPNFIFLGDDTGSARAKIRLADVGVSVGATSGEFPGRIGID